MELFKLRGTLSKKVSTLLSIGGVVLFFMVWQMVRSFTNVPHAILPSPLEVFASLKELHFEDFLVVNLWYSIKINLWGYFEAILIALPLGYLIGLFPFTRELFSKIFDAVRYIPFTAVTGIFIAWFGIGTDMKEHFLAAAILVYLLPTVVQRVINFQEVYDQTAFTMGASKWQRIRDVFIRGTLPEIADDIRVLIAISWTYIIVAELINAEGGVGKLIFYASRENRFDKVFAVLIIIMLVGILQDYVFKQIDKKIFRFKYK